jgi:ABC-2 type transport system permease protein
VASDAPGVLAPHLALVRASLRAQLAYRLSAALLLLTAALATFLDFLVIAAIFTHLPRLAGWTLPEVALLYGIAGVGFGITDLCIGTLDSLPQQIRDGGFDLVLLRPVGTLYQVLAREFGVRRIGKAAQSAAVLALAVAHLSIAWTPARVAMLTVALVAGPLIFGSIWVIAITHVFWTVDTGEVANAFTYGGSFLTQYPVNLFAGWLRDLLAFVVPMAFVAYEPALFILGRADPMGLPPFTPLLTPAVGAALVAVAWLAWRTGVRHYRGTGS